MAKVGKWGSIVTFQTSVDKILTFRNFKRSVSGRWKTHNIVGKKPKLEFVGPGAASITMDVTLSAEHGVKPRTVIETLEAACEDGTVAYMYIGGKKVGSRKLYLQSMSETWDEVWNQGELVEATLSLTFSEYR